jgi:hypothetical protein
MQRLAPGPAEGITRHRELRHKMKFIYRHVLGELIYAHFVTHFDIGYVALLA